MASDDPLVDLDTACAQCVDPASDPASQLRAVRFLEAHALADLRALPKAAGALRGCLESDSPAAVALRACVAAGNLFRGCLPRFAAEPQASAARLETEVRAKKAACLPRTFSIGKLSMVL